MARVPEPSSGSSSCSSSHRSMLKSVNSSSHDVNSAGCAQAGWGRETSSPWMLTFLAKPSRHASGEGTRNGGAGHRRLVLELSAERGRRSQRSSSSGAAARRPAGDARRAWDSHEGTGGWRADDPDAARAGSARHGGPRHGAGSGNHVEANGEANGNRRRDPARARGRFVQNRSATPRRGRAPGCKRRRFDTGVGGPSRADVRRVDRRLRSRGEGGGRDRIRTA